MKMCFDVKSSTYHFHMTTKMLADFHICISAPLKQIFWKKKTIFKKLEYHFLVEKTKIENASFPYRTALSEANVKTNRMVTTKERIFASNCFIFLKFCFSLRTSYKELILCTNNPNAHIHIFCKRWTFT